MGQLLAANNQSSKLLGLCEHTAPVETSMLFDFTLGQLRKGHTCRMTGDVECGYEPSLHSPDCGNRSVFLKGPTDGGVDDDGSPPFLPTLVVIP